MAKPIVAANRTLAWALVLLGLVGTVNLLLPREARLPIGGLLTPLGPALLAAGAVLLRFTRPGRPSGIAPPPTLPR